MEFDNITEIQNPRLIEGLPQSRLEGIAMTRDGALLASWIRGRSYPGKSETHDPTTDMLYLIHLDASRVIRELRGQLWRISDIAFSKDGSLLASCGRLGGVHQRAGKGHVEVWRAATGEPLISFGEFSTPVKRIAFSPCENLLFCATARPEPGASASRRIPTSGLALLDVETGEATGTPLGEIDPSHELQHVAFSSDGEMMAASSWNPLLESRGSEIVVWKISKSWLTKRPSLQKTRLWDTQKVESLDFHPTMAELATISRTGPGQISIHLWNIKSGEKKEFYRGKNTFLKINAIKYHPGGEILAVSGDPADYRDESGIWLFDRATGGSFPIPNSKSHHIAFGNHGRHLLNFWSSGVAILGGF